jgi:hypothetical protein
MSVKFVLSPYERKIRVSENNLLTRIFKVKEATGGWKKLKRKEELHHFSSPPNILVLYGSAGHVA